MSAPATIDPTTRRVPPLGGFNLTVLGIELAPDAAQPPHGHLHPGPPGRALLRDHRQRHRPGTTRSASGNEAAYILISMALYGAALTAAAGGSMVAMERALGWSRQLRLTPLNPVAYILIKALVALDDGRARDRRRQPLRPRPGTRRDADRRLDRLRRVVTLFCTLTFAALGVFVGYVVPGENAMQILGPGLALLSFLGGVFWPLTEGSALWHVATFTPMYGVAEVARAPLTHELPWYAVVNAVALARDLRRPAPPGG